MSSIIQSLIKKGLISPPKWVESQLIFEAITGSTSYGMASEGSDIDVVGIVMPPKDHLFPNLRGSINGFGPPPECFSTWQQHAIKDSGQEYGVTLYGISRYFDLAASANPNITDILFSPQFCIRVNTAIGQHLRANRKMFLHKGAKHKFIGYAYSQLKRIGNKDKEGKRGELILAHKFDTKYSAHLVRLCLECAQILEEGDLDITRNSATIKAIREGKWTEEDVNKFFHEKEKYLEELYNKSTLPHGPDMDAIRGLLMECISMHYEGLDKVVKVEGKNDNILRQIKELAEKADL